MTKTPFDLVVRNGTVATASDVYRADVGVRGGRIAAIGHDLVGAEREIDASGCFVLPGGVDSHVHVEQRGNPTGPEFEDFESATRSAACGGTTTFISFARQVKGEGIAVSVEEYEQNVRRALIDVAFHLTITDPTPTVLQQELPALIARGHRSIKLFMTTHRSRVDDDGILAVLEVARQHGAMMVVHAENYAATNWLTDRLLSEGKWGAQYNGRSKTEVVEREAVHRIISLAEIVGVPIQIFHVSSRAALEEIERAQGRGLPIFAETCPQYLLFTESDLHDSDEEAACLVFGPPPRTEADQAALWLSIARNIIGVVSSDHSPHNLRGVHGKLTAAEKGGFKATPHGIPGLETRLPILFSEGVVKGRIDLTRFVDITSTAPAKIFGLYPRKGSITIGADADLALWDPRRKMRIANGLLHHKVDYTPYEGIEVTGLPVTTVSRGEVVWTGGKFDAREGRGQLLLRSAYALPSLGKAGLPAAQSLLQERGS